MENFNQTKAQVAPSNFEHFGKKITAFVFYFYKKKKKKNRDTETQVQIQNGYGEDSLRMSNT